MSARPASRGGDLAIGALGVLAALAGLLTALDSLRTAVPASSDTTDLVIVVDQALAHLRSGQLLHWGGYYALLQAIPVFALRGAGVSVAHVFTSLVALNLVSYAAIVAVSWRLLARASRAGAIVMLVVLLSSPMLMLLRTTAGEPLAAAVTLVAVALSWNDRGHLRAAALLFLTGLSKDTAVPFVLLLCLGASICGACWTDSSWRRRRVASLLVAAAASLLVNAAYNYVRFGSVLNVPYLNPLDYVPWLSTQLSFLAAIWLSPNGGLLLFWPSFGVLLAFAAAAAVHAVKASTEERARLRRAAPAAAVGLVLLGMTLELSRWVAPLGWSGWGPRLLMPWVPASAFLLVAAYGGELERVIAAFLRPTWRFWLAGIALAVASIPQYVAIGRPTIWMEIFVPDAACPAVPIIENGASYYYHCTNHELWTKGTVLLSAFKPGADPIPLVLAAACAAALLWLISLLRTG